MLLVLTSLLLISSCNGVRVSDKEGEISVSEEKSADDRIEQIISAINDKDKEALKSLFSKKALDETDDFDSGMDSLFDFIQGDIKSWESDGWSSSESAEYGKSSLMIRSSFIIKTDKEEYVFFIVDYSVDTMNPDNEGLYMLQVRTSGYNEDLGSWQDRLRAGFYIPEESGD